MNKLRISDKQTRQLIDIAPKPEKQAYVHELNKAINFYNLGRNFFCMDAVIACGITTAVFLTMHFSQSYTWRVPAYAFGSFSIVCGFIYLVSNTPIKVLTKEKERIESILRKEDAETNKANKIGV